MTSDNKTYLARRTRMGAGAECASDLQCNLCGATWAAHDVAVWKCSGGARVEGGLRTLACLGGRLGPWGKFDLGELSLSEGILTFTSDAHGPIFRAPVPAVRARFPKLYFGIGIKVAVGDKVCRLWFVRWQSMRGQTERDGDMIMAGNEFLLSDVGPAKAAVRQWRAALSQPTLGG
ncbi:hypothetical protein [Kribbella sp. NBC_00359]|uniref:hypothetical protein n=1 Tax=Kribbella sp. NBC_00359 TaxID=2975966 RepID=UPI002E202F59